MVQLGSSNQEEVEVAAEKARLGAVSGYISEAATTVEEIATRIVTRDKSTARRDQARLALSLRASWARSALSSAPATSIRTVTAARIREIPP